MKQAMRAGAAALAAAALVLTSAQTAHAQKTVRHDGAGDVWSGTYNAETDTVDYERADTSPRNADLESTMVKHGTRNLKITTTYARLAKRDYGFHPHWLLQTDAGNTFTAFIHAGGSVAWAGDHYLQGGGPGRVFTDAEQPTSPRGSQCPEMTHDITYRTNQVTVVIPRSCIADPSSIRVRSHAYAWDEQFNERWFDNGHNIGSADNGWTRRLVSGPAR